MHRYETPVRLSQSLLWSLQARAYGRGLAAWSSGAVPSYVSTNAFLARRYAQVIEGFARDAGRVDERITILEMGAGSGRLAYYIVRSLARLWSAAAGALPPFRYVLTDVTGRNIDAWKASGAFDSFIRAGQVDFARFDADLPDAVSLVESGEQISADSPVPNAVLVANYVVSSLRQDLFRMEGGSIFETRVAIATEDRGELTDADILGRLSLDREDVPAELPYYDDPDLDGLLARYSQKLRQSAVMMPVAFLGACRHLTQMVDGPMLALVGDHGPRSLREIEGREAPPAMVHGDYVSLPANLDAVAAFAARQGGGAMFADDIDDLFVVGGITFGARPARLPDTTRAYHRAFGMDGPRDLYGLLSHVGNGKERLSAEAALYALRLSNHDPRTLVQLAPSLERTPDDAPAALRLALVAALDRVRDNHYPLGIVTDVAYRLGRIYQRLGEPSRAIACFEQSTAQASVRYMRHYRIAQCHAALGQLDAARRCITLCLDENPDFDRAQALQSRLARA